MLTVYLTVLLRYLVIIRYRLQGNLTPPLRKPAVNRIFLTVLIGASHLLYLIDLQDGFHCAVDWVDQGLGSSSRHVYIYIEVYLKLRHGNAHHGRLGECVQLAWVTKVLNVNFVSNKFIWMFGVAILRRQSLC